MDHPGDAARIAVARRVAAATRVVVVAVIGLALGAAVGSAFVRSVPDRLPDKETALAAAALVYPAPPDFVGGENGPSRVPNEDWPMEEWWQKLFIGEIDQDGALNMSWDSDAHVAATDEIAYRRLLDAEAGLRAAGWTIDRRLDSLRRIDGTPTPDDGLLAHKGTIELQLSSDGGNAPSLSLYTLADPAPAGPIVGCAVVGTFIAVAWLFLRRRVQGGPRGQLGAAGAGLLGPSAVLVVGAAIAEGAWGESPADLWQAARLFLPIAPVGMLLNIGLVLLAVDVFLVIRNARAKPAV